MTDMMEGTKITKRKKTQIEPNEVNVSGHHDIVSNLPNNQRVNDRYIYRSNSSTVLTRTNNKDSDKGQHGQGRMPGHP